VRHDLLRRELAGRFRARPSLLRDRDSADHRPEHDLSERLDRLERTLLERLDALDQRIQSPAKTIGAEGKEYDLLKEIDEVASTSDTDTLRPLLDEYLGQFGRSPNAPLIEKMQRELEVIGSPRRRTGGSSLSIRARQVAGSTSRAPK
jgi:hypothetical protein